MQFIGGRLSSLLYCPGEAAVRSKHMDAGVVLKPNLQPDSIMRRSSAAFSS